MDGRKIPPELENPFDNVFIAIAIYLNTHVFKPLGFITPNIITTLSLILGIVSLYCFYKGNIILFTILFLISYILDCADGNYARKYNTVTRFGDYYDHVSDVLKLIGLLVLVWVSPIMTHEHKHIFYIFVILLTFLANVHLGCQEKIYKGTIEESGFLKSTAILCPGDKHWIYITRYFGVGTMQLFIVIFIICFTS